MNATKIITEKQADGRFKFVAITGRKTNRSVRSWETKRAAMAAGRREYRLADGYFQSIGHAAGL